MLNFHFAMHTVVMTVLVISTVFLERIETFSLKVTGLEICILWILVRKGECI